VTATADVLASTIRDVIDDSTNNSVRSKQSKNHVLGVSDIGGCREYIRRMIVAEPFSHQPTGYNLASFVGTAVGDHIERAVARWYEKQGQPADTQLSVRIALSNGIVLAGHPDLVLPDMVVDFKTVDGLGVVRRHANRQHRWQVTLYTAALINEGRLAPDATCVLAYLDRSGADSEPHVVMWQYDPDDLAEIVDWLDDVTYALDHNEEASRDKPRDWCFACCPFAVACRQDDSDVTGLITDEDFLAAVKTYQEAQRRIKDAEREKTAAASALAGMSGNTGEYSVRWINVGPSVVPEQVRSGYSRLDIRPIRSGLKGAPPPREETDEPGTAGRQAPGVANGL
jgi:CRISPR/Cas system-associated exonuclease Cas4 (RecB family)